MHLEVLLKENMGTTIKTREEFLDRFEAAKQRKREMVAKMKEEMTIECEKRYGKKPNSFFVL